MIRRPPRSTLSSSSAASDVYKRQDLMSGDKREVDDAEPQPAKKLKPEPPPMPRTPEAGEHDQTAPSSVAASQSAVPCPPEGAPDDNKEPPIPLSRTRRAQFWYYRDIAGQTQGPFYPGQMCEWYTAGHFASSHQVAPSFQGEVPRSFYAISALFKQGLAFGCDPDIAWKPPAELEQEVQYSDEELRAQLRDKLLNRNNSNGPVFAGKWVDN
eukprot:TRINITY_DN13697_c0_g1_i1.p1 TRINITY_DN13697_c0_g1~~TRINITY_DN13697_c0_g1_i1.p1  ORF type:complete len:212 (+),score=41.06 TRINITY_DN13697_c0_g1_i1:104-739(+)